MTWREELQMPDWVEVGADVYAVHNLGGVRSYTTVSRLEIDRVTKTQVVVGVDRPVYESGKVVGSTRYTRRFKLVRNYSGTARLEELGKERYSRDFLVHAFSKYMLNHFSQAEFDAIDSRIRTLTDEISKDRWLTTAKVEKASTELLSLIEMRKNQDVMQSEIDDMPEDNAR